MKVYLVGLETQDVIKLKRIAPRRNLFLRPSMSEFTIRY